MIAEAAAPPERSAPRRGGRPSLIDSAGLRDRILDVATELFLAHGFGVTTIEAVAKGARISKRTFYHRFADKAALFEAVVRRLIDRWLPAFDAQLLKPAPIEEVLRGTARQVLLVALTPEALALHRIMLAEAPRFPELERAMNEAGARKGVEHIAALLERAAASDHLRIGDSAFAAQQFLTMTVSVPQRRAIGVGERLTQQELDRWIELTVDLFLNGWRKEAPSGDASADRLIASDREAVKDERKR
jgi:TetR/AcrR family transcriptional repressor of mexJK operon